MQNKEYRTTEQYQEIIESMTNGNWSQAGAECVEYGFYANDLLNALEADDMIEECSIQWCEMVKDFVLLTEMASRLRYEEAN